MEAAPLVFRGSSPYATVSFLRRRPFLELVLSFALLVQCMVPLFSYFVGSLTYIAFVHTGSCLCIVANGQTWYERPSDVNYKQFHS